MRPCEEPTDKQGLSVETDVWIDNPFSTRFVQPGAHEFLFSAGESMADLAQRFASNGWQGQIVGPHGSGKSTLLAGLTPVLRGMGKTPLLIELHDGQRRLPTEDRRTMNRLSNNDVIVIDGYEQLSRWSKWRIGRRCRALRLGVLITTHEPTPGLPIIYRMHPDVRRARELVNRLIESRDLPVALRKLISAEDVQRAFDGNDGDIREALFELYDLFDARRHALPPPLD